MGAMNTGIMGMSELIIVTLMAGGLMEIIRVKGGITFILERLTQRIHGMRGAECCIAALVTLTDFCTANNTIAILTVGPLARNISKHYGVDPRRSASLLDTFSCFAQGIIPCGAQMLIASGLAHVSPLQIIPFLYYPFILGGVSLMYIFLHPATKPAE
jgi:Na+/H+ antiporter NhaC